MKIISQKAYQKILQIKGYNARCCGHTMANGKCYELWTYAENKAIGCRKRIGSKVILYK